MAIEITGMPRDFCPQNCVFMNLTAHGAIRPLNMFGYMVSDLDYGGTASNHTMTKDNLAQHTFGAEKYPTHYRPSFRCCYENICAMWAGRQNKNTE